MSAADNTYYYKIENDVYLGVIIYLDDMLIASNNDCSSQDFQGISWKALSV